MKRAILYLIILICLTPELAAQDCPLTTITLSTQNEIDSFSILYPDCQDINTSLQIIEDDNGNITSLAGLSQIFSIGLNLRIEGTQLENLDGLNNIDSIGGNLTIEENDLLTSLDAISDLLFLSNSISILRNDILTDISAFSNLNSLQSLALHQNPLLSDLSGFQFLDTIANMHLFGNGDIVDFTAFSSLKSLNNLTLGSGSIGNSSSIQTLTGLEEITQMDNFSVFNSSALTSLQGLNNLTKMHTLTFWGVQPLTNLNGLESLDTMHSLLLTFCYDLQTLQGLNNLDVVTDVVLLAANDQLTNLSGLNNLKSANSLQVNVNEGLISLNGLENLIELDTTLRIHGNDNLVDISAIQNTDIEDLSLLRISENPQLSVCSYDNICDYLTSGGNNSILGNNEGCTNQVEVFDVCISNQNNTRFQGNVWADFDLDCDFDIEEEGIPQILLSLQGENYQYFFPADSAGFYNVPVLAGDYTLSVISPSSYWIACDFDALLTASGNNDTIQTDFFMQPQGDCSFIDWNMNLNGLRICGTRSATINLCNNGVQTAEDVLTMIDLGDFVSLESASVPYMINTEGIIEIAFDSLELFECVSIELELFTDCDSVSIDDILCIDVSLITDDICSPDTIWDESNIYASGYCEGDSTYFSLKNIGIGDMLTSATYNVDILIEDIVLLMDNGEYQLPSGDSIVLVYPNIGSGYHVEAEQTEGHPISSDALVTVSNCQDFMAGIGLNFFPNNNGDLFTGTFCTFAANSFDPNVKSVIPIGTGEEHFIEDDWELDYTIQFQNTGNDVAYEVIIRDTISENLDFSTLNIRGATHDFTWTIIEDRVLEFTFENILLPDSTSNEPESHGMVSYSISPTTGLLPLTIIENSAAIYFDFNDPIITNTVFHTIRKPVIQVVEELDWCSGGFFNGIPIMNDTFFIEVVEFLEYDSAHFTYLTVVDTLEVEEMVEVQIGDIFHDVEITEDTIIVLNYTSTYGCDSIVTYNISALTVVGLDDLENLFSKVNVFPNPTTDRLYIDVSSINEKQTFSLTNALGVLVWKATIDRAQNMESINLEKIPTGIYWLEGKAIGQRKVWKIVVTR